MLVTVIPQLWDFVRIFQSSSIKKSLNQLRILFQANQKAFHSGSGGRDWPLCGMAAVRRTKGRLHASSLRIMANLMLPSTAFLRWCDKQMPSLYCLVYHWVNQETLPVAKMHGTWCPSDTQSQYAAIGTSPLNCLGVISIEFKEDFMAAPGWSQCTYRILAFNGQHLRISKLSALSEKIRSPSGQEEFNTLAHPGLTLSMPTAVTMQEKNTWNIKKLYYYVSGENLPHLCQC